MIIVAIDMVCHIQAVPTLMSPFVVVALSHVVGSVPVVLTVEKHSLVRC